MRLSMVLGALALLTLATYAFGVEYGASLSDLIRPCSAKAVTGIDDTVKLTGVPLSAMPFQITVQGSCQAYQQLHALMKSPKYGSIESCKKSVQAEVEHAYEDLIRECSAFCETKKAHWKIDEKSRSMYQRRSGWQENGAGLMASATLNKEISGACQ